jgi:DNA-binding protein HU-beta
VSPTFEQLVAATAIEVGLSKMSTRWVLEAFFKQLAESTWVYGRVSVPGLGLFEVRARKPRYVALPRGGEHMQVPAFRSVRALVAKSWRRRDA